MHTTVELM